MQDSENIVSLKNQKSNIEFLTFDDRQKLCYSGYCKLKINAIGKYLTVEPINEDCKPLSAFFKWKFIRQKNILYIFSENKIQDLILVFKTEKICKKVLLCIEKYSNNASNDEKLDQIHFCVPFVQQLKNLDISRIARNFIRLFSDKEKKKFVQFLKENELYETVFPLLPLYGNKNDNTEKLKVSMKRKLQEFREDDDSDYSHEDAENVRQQKSKQTKTLFEKPKICIKTKKGSGAITANKSVNKIFKKPNYELIEGQINGIKRTRLIIFPYGERNYCDEFSKNGKLKTYHCLECSRLKKIVCAVIHKRNTKSEYVELLSEHICEPRAYQTLSIFEKKRIVNLPDFEIQETVKDGTERKNLIIFFPDSNRKLCYKFSFHTFSKTFFCSQCRHFGRNMYAKDRKNENGEIYIELSGEETHACKPRPHTSANSNHDIALKPSDFHFFPQKLQSKLKNVQSRLFIFDAKNRNFGYEFSHTRDDIYQCLGCHLIRKQHKIVTVKLYKSEITGEYSVRMRPNQIHFCKLRKYEPEKWEEKFVEAPMFQFYSTGQRKDSRLRLAIFTSDDKKLCYIYTNIGQKSFHCIECKHKKIYVSASVCQENPDGSEYIRLGNTKHICKPIKFSNVENEGIKLLKNSGLETKVIKVDKSKIVEETDFELRLSKAGVPNGRMIIIDSKDRTKCYEYFYRKAANRYFCCKCVTVSAVVVKENDKTFIRLGQKDHTCQPVKYEPKKPIIRKPDFKIFNLTDTRRVQRLVIFTTKAQSHCYKYIYDSHNSKYYCSECYSCESKRVTAKLLKDSKGIEYILQSKMDHICEPVTFNKKDFDD